MKLRAAVTAVLVAALGIFSWLAVSEVKEYRTAQAEYDQQVDDLNRRNTLNAEKENSLNALREDDPAAVEEEAAGITRQAEDLREQKTGLESEKAQMESEIGELQQQKETKQTRYDYLTEVYNELCKGLERVKGYLSDN